MPDWYNPFFPIHLAKQDMVDRKTIAMKTFTVEYPESVLTTLKLSPESFEERARVAMAVKLFETGHLTSGQAAKLAGISRVEFMLRCREFGTPSVTWDKEELEAEFNVDSQ